MISTIQQMEAVYQASDKALQQLSAALQQYMQLQPQLDTLCQWYQSPQWLEAYDADAAALLPPPEELPRAVLSQDTIDELLQRNRELLTQMQALTAQAFEMETPND